jgi:hypothetical protein
MIANALLTRLRTRPGFLNRGIVARRKALTGQLVHQVHSMITEHLFMDVAAPMTVACDDSVDKQVEGHFPKDLSLLFGRVSVRNASPRPSVRRPGR